MAWRNYALVSITSLLALTEKNVRMQLLYSTVLLVTLWRWYGLVSTLKLCLERFCLTLHLWTWECWDLAGEGPVIWDYHQHMVYINVSSLTPLPCGLEEEKHLLKSLTKLTQQVSIVSDVKLMSPFLEFSSYHLLPTLQSLLVRVHVSQTNTTSHGLTSSYWYSLIFFTSCYLQYICHNFSKLKVH